MVAGRDKAHALADAQAAALARVLPVEVLDGGVSAPDAHDVVRAVLVAHGHELVGRGLDREVVNALIVLVDGDLARLVRRNEELAGGGERCGGHGVGFLGIDHAFLGGVRGVENAHAVAARENEFGVGRREVAALCVDVDGRGFLRLEIGGGADGERVRGAHGDILTGGLNVRDITKVDDVACGVSILRGGGRRGVAHLLYVVVCGRIRHVRAPGHRSASQAHSEGGGGEPAGGRSGLLHHYSHVGLV